MLQDYLPVAMDFIGSVALICLLSMAYGTVRRQMPGISLAPQLAGVTFGLVAVLQMHAPITPVPGMIIDLRNIPILLAGAFLGVRGLVACLFIAVGGRIGIGGVGLSSAVVAMMLVGGAGLAWNAMTISTARRGIRHMLGLVALMSVHFVAVLMLPYDLMIWFLTQAALPLLVTYLLVIPIAGTMLERERLQMASEARLRAAARADPEAAFPSRDILQAEVSQAFAAGQYNDGVAAIQMTFRPGLAHASFWGEDIHDLIAVSLHQRIAPLLPQEVLVGQVGAECVVFLAPESMALGMDGLAATIRRDVASAAIRLPGSVPSHPHLTVTRLDYDGIPDLDDLLHGQVCATPNGAQTHQIAASGCGDKRLFEMAERLIAHHRTLRSRSDLERRDV